MQSQQIVDYIATNIKNGHTEKQLRKHLQTYGWKKAAINDAFKRYHASRNQGSMSRTKRRPHRPNGTRARLLIAGGFAALFIAAGAVIYFWPEPKPVVRAAAPMSSSQKQVIDVNTIGGAIGQYTAANGGVLPTHLAIGTTANNLVMCNATCDATTSQISSLLVYKPQNVKLMGYVADLAAPDDQTMYLVPGATCKNQTTLGGPSSSPRSMIILYAANEGSSISQRCVTL